MADRDNGPEDWRDRREMDQGYGEHEYGDDRERFRANEREGIMGGHPDSQSRWDRDRPGWQGREGYRTQNEWSAAHGAWSDPAHEDQRSAGRYAEGGRYYADAGGATRERVHGGGNEGPHRGPGGNEGPHRGRGPRGYRRADDRIREDVCERLTHDSWLDASNVDVQVQDGEVTLTGTVDSRAAKRRAEDTIENISGVRDVHNQLRVDAGALQGQNTTDLTVTQNGGPGRNESPHRAA